MPFKKPDAGRPGVYIDTPLTLMINSSNFQRGDRPNETMTVDVTLPPLPQVVWLVRFEAKAQDGINRETLLSALRGKYGAETYKPETGAAQYT